jgi:ubiquinone/menaquinone biosynthesis C-methylase UbiE
MIAPLYDGQPYRGKEVDRHLIAFMQQRASSLTSTLAVLDIGCGTGSQLVANRRHFGAGVYIGLDPFHGMLQQGLEKARGIGWVQADGARPPFADASFDFITNQFAFHHVQDKAAMIHAVYRLLKPSGQFVMTNISPWDMPDWPYYQYFPTAFEADCQDFLPTEQLVELMCQAGFSGTTLETEFLNYTQDLHEFVAIVRRRDTCSQLLTISNADYHAGLSQLERELASAGQRNLQVHVNMCLLTLSGNKTLSE